MVKQKILVCGGRDFGSVPTSVLNAPWEISDEEMKEHRAKAVREQALFQKIMETAKAKFDIHCIIEGGAKGADRMAYIWATKNNIQVHTCKADWNKHGKKAGILRNATMLEEHNPTLVIAFPGGVGTKDMVTRSRAAGVKVIEVPAT